MEYNVFDSEKAHKALSSTGFKAGVIRGLTIKEMFLDETDPSSDLEPRLKIIFTNKDLEELTMVLFGPNEKYMNDRNREFSINVAVERVMEIIRLFYPNGSVKVSAQTWSEFLKKVTMKYKEAPDKNILLRGVFTYTQSGFLKLRSGNQVNIERDDDSESRLRLLDTDVIIRPVTGDQEIKRMSGKEYFERISEDSDEDSNEDSDDLPF